MFKEKVILVDDEPNILSGYRRGLRQHFKLETATSGPKALELMAENGPYAVVVSDMRMPRMDGVELLHRVKQAHPDMVRIMLTGNADQETAMQAVNKGSIFRFLTKPCSSQSLITTLTVAIQQYRLVTAEKELLEKTLKGSVKVLVDLLSLADPEIFHHATRLRSTIREVGPKVDLRNLWELEVAAMLTPIGQLTLPPELRAKARGGSRLSDKEQQALDDTTEIGNRLLSNIPRLETVSELVRWSKAPLTELPDEGEEGRRAHIFRILSDLVERQGDGDNPLPVLKSMAKGKRGVHLDILREIGHVLGAEVEEKTSEDWEVMEVRIRNVIVGDVLEKNVETLSGTMLLAKGTRVTGAFLERIRNYRKLDGVVEPIKIKRRVLR